jgi:hypothetical protein
MGEGLPLGRNTRRLLPSHSFPPPRINLQDQDPHILQPTADAESNLHFLPI